MAQAPSAGKKIATPQMQVQGLGNILAKASFGEGYRSCKHMTKQETS